MRILFIHVYATGGTSLMQCLTDHVGEEYTCNERLWPFKGNPRNSNLMSGHIRLIDGLQVFEPDVTVTLLRDPVERIYSIWNKMRLRRTPQHMEKIEWLRKAASHDFEFFLECCKPPSQYPWSHIYFGGAPEDALKNIRRYVDKVFFLDNIPDMVGWLRSLGWRGEFPHANSFSHKKEPMTVEQRRLARFVVRTELDFFTKVRILHHKQDEGTDHCY